MFNSLSLPTLLLIFVVAAAAVWIAGIQLTNTSVVLSSRLGLGEALGGLLLLAIATNLPESAITLSAALHHNLGIATGNILGGIAIQTVVLVVLDVFGVGGKYPLTYRAASLTLVLEGVLVIAVLVVAIMCTQLPSSVIFARVTPAGVLIPGLWLVGLWLIGKARTDLPWQELSLASIIQTDSVGQINPLVVEDSELPLPTSDKEVSARQAVIIFTIASVITLVAGVALEQSGGVLAARIGINGVLFGATILAAATALPEVSTGLASVKLQDYELAVSDVFGGNAFLPVLFLLATLLSGEAVLPQATKLDIYISGLGILLTTIYIYGLIFRPSRRILNMGIDSLVVLVLYVLGIIGIITLASS